MRWIYAFLPLIAAAQTTPPSASTQPPPATIQTPPAPSAAELMRSAVQKQRASIALQQNAARQQAQSLGAKLIPWTDFDPDTPACDPIAAELVTPLIETAAKANDLEVNLVHALIEQESGFHACAVSPKGAQGLMQLMPDTAADFGVKDIFDPQENIAAGTKYLKQLLDKYKGDRKLALAAYNAGPAAVDAANGVPDIPETRDYVEAILARIKN